MAGEAGLCAPPIIIIIIIQHLYSAIMSYADTEALEAKFEVHRPYRSQNLMHFVCENKSPSDLEF